MREACKQFVKICAETLPVVGPIYEFGSLQVAKRFCKAELRQFFPDKKYIGADIRKGPGVDVVLDLQKIGLPSNSVGTILVMDTLEHVEFIRGAIDEAHRVLKSNGIFIVSSIMLFPIHNCPYDYWRFTPEAFKSLLKPFASSFVGFAGEGSFPHTVVGVGFKGLMPENSLDEFMNKFKIWEKEWRFPRGWKGLIELWAPPVLFNLYRRYHR